MSTQLYKTVNTALHPAWDWLLPSHCSLCGDPAKRGEIICPQCKLDLPNNPIHCPRCALPMPRPELCGQCLRKSPVFDHAIAPLIYTPPIDGLISQLKYNHRLAACRTFASLIKQQLTDLGTPLPEALIAVPLHQQRIRQRGFNQSVEIARPLARLIGRPLLTQLVKRHKATPAQTGLSGGARRKNLRGAFSITGTTRVKHVALIDDVMTTGSTATELARTLKNSGLARVDIWVVARVTGRAQHLT